MKKVEVVIVNQAKLICNLLAIVLGEEPDIEVVAHATAVDEALKLAKKCDIMLADAALPNDGALALTIEVGQKHPHTHVLVTGVDKKPNTILKYIEAGASGYILKEFTKEELLAQIRALPEGKAYADPEMVALLIERVSELADRCGDMETWQKGLNSLSPRENEVLALLEESKSNQEISDALHIEVGTVKNHVHNILKKLGVASRQEAARLTAQPEEPA